MQKNSAELNSIAVNCEKHQFKANKKDAIPLEFGRVNQGHYSDLQVRKIGSGSGSESEEDGQITSSKIKTEIKKADKQENYA